MVTLPASVRIYVAAEPVDLRRSFDGLAAATRRLIGAARQPPFPLAQDTLVLRVSASVNRESLPNLRFLFYSHHEATMDVTQQALPTPLAQVARRLNTLGLEASADSFLLTSYLFEAALKILAVAFTSALRQKAPDLAYRIGYEVVRADGLGTWEQAVRTAASLPAASFLPREMAPALTWITQRRGRPEDTWFADAAVAVAKVCQKLGIETTIPDRKPNVLHLVTGLVEIRNKTKAHGAVGPIFFSSATPSYSTAVRLLLEHCPLFTWSWIYFYHRSAGHKKGIQLRGDSPYALRDTEVQQIEILEPGVHFWPPGGAAPIPCSQLLFADAECREFFLPNGGYSATRSTAEFIDYGTGRTTSFEIPHFGRPPAPLPPSETHGLEALDVQSNVLGNLPPFPHGYVQRLSLQDELETRLKDRNHPVITLHGRGGIGKTSLALWMAHKLAAENPAPFDAIVWFSARDVDLRPTGPRSVRPAVINLSDVARLYGGLTDAAIGIDEFAAILQGRHASGLGHLFIFDNFETFADVVEIHRFLDTHTHIPNKVLITSRERAFKADFPIEVHGMARAEAWELLRRAAADLGIEALMTDDTTERLYDYSEGHPYVLRVLAGEIAKERRFVPPKALIPRRMDLVSAVFERSFVRLSDVGRRVFLTVSSWRSAVSELALIVVLGRHGLDVEGGIEECTRLSLLTSLRFADDQRAFTAPQLARVFGSKKLEGDPDRLLIDEDLEILRRFGVVPVGQPIQIPEDTAVEQFVTWCVSEAAQQEEQRNVIDGILETLAELWPRAWLGLADFRRRAGSPREAIEYALRRAVEENPANKYIVLERGNYARLVGDESTWISSRIRAVELDPSDVELVREVANDLNEYMSRHSAEIPQARRGVYLASVRERMGRLADSLDATGLSRLAWLYLHEGNMEEAAHYTYRGLEKEPGNVHCQRLAARLPGQS
jgi:hypothetical protein